MIGRIFLMAIVVLAGVFVPSLLAIIKQLRRIADALEKRP